MHAQTTQHSPSRQNWALSRRQLLQAAVVQAVSLPLLPWLAADEASAAEPPPPLPPLNRFPRMVQEYFVAQVRAAEAKGLAAKQALQTKADAEAYVQSVRAKIRTCFGPEPERTPLNPRVTGVVERDAYRIEKVIFDSRPGFPVTANLYLPTGRSQRVPGVVGTCGHSTNGKAEKAYQSFAQGLARMGYACLIYDPLGQGERLQYVKEDLSPRFGAGVTEHLIAGNQQFLVGEFLGMWRAWDGIRALDYLLTRPEVDPQQIGVTGNSGGGTMTTWLCGVEQRWSMAAPSCFVTTFRRNMENELPADTEQCPPQALALGLDHDDFLAALAPKPIIILGKERDYFDARGVEEAHARLRRLYELLGVPDQIGVFIGPTTHGYTQENREAMYRWFNQVTKVSEATAEPPLTLEEDQTAVVYAERPGRRTRRTHRVSVHPREIPGTGGGTRRSVRRGLDAGGDGRFETAAPYRDARLSDPALPERPPLPAAAGRGVRRGNRTGHPGAGLSLVPGVVVFASAAYGPAGDSVRGSFVQRRRAA